MSFFAWSTCKAQNSWFLCILYRRVQSYYSRFGYNKLLLLLYSDVTTYLNNLSIYIYLSGFHKRCLYWVPRRSSPRSHYSPSPPMKLMTSESLPPSSASSVMIMSHRIDLAGLGHRKSVLLTVKPIIAADNLGKIDKLYGTIFCTVFGLNKSSNEGDNRRLWLLHWS